MLLAMSGASLAAGDVRRDCDYTYDSVVEAQSDQGYEVRAISAGDLNSFRNYLDDVSQTMTANNKTTTEDQRSDGPSAIISTSGGCVEQITLPGSIHQLRGWD